MFKTFIFNLKDFFLNNFKIKINAKKLFLIFLESTNDRYLWLDLHYQNKLWLG